VKAVQIVG